MLQHTGQVSTHRETMWILGLLISAAAMGAASAEAIAETARQLACLPDRNASKLDIDGVQATRPDRLTGALAEAEAGFPSIIVAGLPRLRLSRQIDDCETLARLNTLLAIMTRLDDAHLLQQGGQAALKIAQAGAVSILDAGGVATPEGWGLLQQLDRDLLARKSSPRGSADMLATTIFIDYVSRHEELDVKAVSPDRKPASPSTHRHLLRCSLGEISSAKAASSSPGNAVRSAPDFQKTPWTLRPGRTSNSRRQWKRR